MKHEQIKHFPLDVCLMLIWNDVLQIQFEFNIFHERQDAVCGRGVGGEWKIRLNFIVILSWTAPRIKPGMLYMAWTYEPQKRSPRGKTGEMSCEILQQRRERSVIGGVKLRLVEMASHDQLIANTPASIHELRSTNQTLCLNNLLICSTPPCRSTRKITAQTMTSQYGQVAFSTKTALTTNHRQTFHSWKTAVLGNWVAAPNRRHTSAHVPEPRSPLLQRKNTTSLRHPFPSSQVYTRRTCCRHVHQTMWVLQCKW